MSQEYAWPSSLDLEIEARRLHASPRDTVDDDTALALALRRFPQAFDLTIFGLAAILVFPQTFFSGLSSADAIIAGLGLCALAPLVSRFSSPLFRLVERRHGRGVRLTAARVMLGAATAMIAFLPDAGRLGAVAGVLLIGCRLAQGLAMGGLSAPAAESAAGPRSAALGWSALAGLVAASLVFGLLFALTNGADFLQWGWRYPFVMAIACNISALFADLRLLATPHGASSSPGGMRVVARSGVLVD